MKKWNFATAVAILVTIAGMAVAQSIPKGSSTFDDVPAGHWADDAIGWAVNAGIVSGVSPRKFDPNGTLTRAEMVTILYRYHTKFGGPEASGADPKPGEVVSAEHETFYRPSTGITVQQSLAKLDRIRVAPESCSAFKDTFYAQAHPAPIDASVSAGLLTHKISNRQWGHVVAHYEAWCSGIRHTNFGYDAYNLWEMKGSIIRGKAHYDPREWWDSGGNSSPRLTNYPGWCTYLHIHIEVKAFSDGTMDEAEHAFLKSEINKCPPVDLWDDPEIHP